MTVIVKKKRAQTSTNLNDRNTITLKHIRIIRLLIGVCARDVLLHMTS